MREATQLEAVKLLKHLTHFAGAYLLDAVVAQDAVDLFSFIHTQYMAQHEATTLHDKKNMLNQVNNRQDRLQELADKGMDYLQMEDKKQANVKLCPLVRVWAQGGKITEVEVL